MHVVIRSAAGRKRAQIDTWRYWKIIGVLRDLGEDRQQAYSNAHWATRAKAGDTRTTTEGLKMEVTEA